MSSRLLFADLLRVGAVGLRTRRLRAVLSALGIAIGIASMVAVLGLSESSRAGLLHQLDRLGTNLLTAAPGQTLGGDDATLPESAAQTLRRVGGVQRVDSVRALDATVRRSDRIDPEETGGIAVDAADPGLLGTLGGSMVRGRFLNAATAGTRSVVLGATAARQLGVDRPGALVYIAGRWWTVLGVMAPGRARARARSRGLHGLRRRGARARRRALGEHRVPARRPVGRRARARPGPGGGQPRASRGGRRQPPVGRARGARAGRRRPDRPVPGPRRGGAARRRHRHRQHDGHLGPRAPLGDRPAPGARRHPRARARAVPRRVAAAGGRRRARGDRGRRRSSPASTRAPAAGPRSCRPRRSRAASARRWPSARPRGSTRPAARRGCRRRRRCGGREWLGRRARVARQPVRRLAPSGFRANSDWFATSTLPRDPAASLGAWPRTAARATRGSAPTARPTRA